MHKLRRVRVPPIIPRLINIDALREFLYCPYPICEWCYYCSYYCSFCKEEIDTSRTV